MHSQYHPEDDQQAESDYVESCVRAVEAANRLGIYAVPCTYSKRTYWKPRTRGGFDPDLGWLIKNQPTLSGWKSWADAVIALAGLIEQEK